MQQVTVSRKVAGIILAGCLALGVLVGVASNFSKQSMTGLRGSTAEAASVGRRLTNSDPEDNAITVDAKSEERELVNSPWDNLVWPDEKDVATDTAFDGWAGNTDGTDLDVLLDYSYSYEY